MEHLDRASRSRPTSDPASVSGRSPDATTDVDPKKARACDACRALKVRCDPNRDDDAGPCRRCQKAGRACVITAPTRKRQKKTDSRVAELERKIDALTASLQSRASASAAVAAPAAGGVGRRRSGSSTSPGSRTTDERHAGSDPRLSGTPRPVSSAARKRKASERWDGPEEDCGHGPFPRPGAVPPQPSLLVDHGAGDIVDRGILSLDTAEQLFARYTNVMIKHIPAVVFPPGVTAATLRASKPTLFLAVMASAASESHEVQKALQKELMQVLAHKILVTGEKRLELVQAIQIAAIWYWPPEHFEELKFYQLIHIAAVMALDIGLGQKTAQRRTLPIFAPRDQPFLSSSSATASASCSSCYCDPATIEARRAWLTCYLLTINTTLALHRPVLVRWTPFMSESIDILSRSPDAAPTDAYFCRLVCAHHLIEEVGLQFSPDDGAPTPSICHARTQFILRALERKLDKQRRDVPPDLMQPVLRITLDVVDIYLHELVLQSGGPADQASSSSSPSRAPLSADGLQDGLVGAASLSPQHIDGLSACLVAINDAIDTFLSFDVEQTRCLPALNFARVAYALVILLKMYFSAGGAELGAIIGRDKIRVDHYLDRLMAKFREAAADDRCRPAAKFLVVLAMLRSWFVRHATAQDGNNGGGGSSAAAAASFRPDGSTRAAGPLPPGASSGKAAPSSAPQQQDMHPPPPRTANTPLELLSEVATVGDAQSARPGFSTRHGPSPVPGPAFFHDAAAAVSSSSSPADSLPAPHQQQQHDQTPLSTPPGYTPQPGTSHAGNPVSTTATTAANSSSSGGHAFDPGLVAAMAPAFPPWAPTTLGPPIFDVPPGMDLASVGLPPGRPEAYYEDGARMVMNEPWFVDVFTGMTGSNPFLFPL